MALTNAELREIAEALRWYQEAAKDLSTIVDKQTNTIDKQSRLILKLLAQRDHWHVQCKKLRGEYK